MRIYSRSEWGARYGDGGTGRTKRNEAVAHTTVTPVLSEDASFASEASAMRGMERFHAQNRGFDGIGYSFVVFDSGRILEGRGWSQNGAHTQRGRNSSAYGIAFYGDGTKRPPTEKAWRAAEWLVATGRAEGKLTDDYKVSGHRDYHPKACPGDLIYSKLDRLRTATLKSNPDGYLMGMGSEGEGVRTWQAQLRDILGVKIGVDGDFGPETEKYTRQFEEIKGNAVDGWVSQADIDAMNKSYEEQRLQDADTESADNPNPPADPPPVSYARDYAVAVRHGDSVADHRIARALAAALHIHVARADDPSYVGKVYLVGGQAVRDFDRTKADEVVELSGAGRDQTLDKVSEVISDYIRGL